jgi:predicted AlkP superfamily phosphohydrolase/phosphomutase
VKRLPLFLFVIGVGAVCATGCRRAGSRAAGRRLVVIGFDGMDPALVRTWMAQGRLPNLRSLTATGGMYPLATTPSPEAASVWASFATGVNPGKHGIYGLLGRNGDRTPLLALFRRTEGRFLFDSLRLTGPSYTSLRGGTSFWVTAGQAGIRSSVLNVPMTFPPEAVPGGELLSGLPTPDLRGTLGTYAYYASDLDPRQQGPTPSGGILTRLVFEGDDAHTELPGPPNPLAGARRTDATLHLPLHVHWNRAGRTATIDIGDATVHLQEGEWSRWLDFDFRAGLLVHMSGVAQVYLASAESALRLYVSPINWNPKAPPAPMSWPASLSAALDDRLGPYRTLGWGEATWALNDGRLDERAFMDDVYRLLDDRTQLMLERIDHRQWDLLVGVIGAPDHVQHMLWRLTDPGHPMYDRDLAAKFGGAVEQVYRRCDAFVGEILARVGPDTPMLVVSGYGFHSFRRAVNLNTWLVDQGFMSLAGPTGAERPTLAGVYRGARFWDNVDWSRTRAYAIGFGQLYLNLAGRERGGIVRPGVNARDVEDDLIGRLLALTDPETGARVVSAVYKASDVYAGPHLDSAPDLQVGFAEGYRVSWQTVAGAVPDRVIEPNRQKWSGDHAGFDAASTGGFLISNRPLRAGSVSIMDIAPTVLAYFGVGIPEGLDGKALF